jgi:Domain of unknown function (DUF4396)
VHCLTGCAIGEVLGMVIGTSAGFLDGATIALAVALAFVFGYALTIRAASHGWGCRCAGPAGPTPGQHSTPASPGGPGSGALSRRVEAAPASSASEDVAVLGDRQELVTHRRAARASEGPVERPPRTRGLTTLPPAGRHAAHVFVPLIEVMWCHP